MSFRPADAGLHQHPVRLWSSDGDRPPHAAGRARAERRSLPARPVRRRGFIRRCSASLCRSWCSAPAVSSACSSTAAIRGKPPYHGVIAGVTLALIGVAYFPPAAVARATEPKPPPRRLDHRPLRLGPARRLLSRGLSIAGGHGAPRKVAGAAQGLSDWAAYAGMGLNGLGGLVAVIGGILFVWTMAAALLAQSLPATISATGART